jgi:hypothetical protein
MHDNKLRLSPDVIQKAEQIAVEWGLKNSRAAVEAVFRKYADDYLYGRQAMFAETPSLAIAIESPAAQMPEMPETGCQAASELDSLLGL